MGKIILVMVMDVLLGDKFIIEISYLIWFLLLVVLVMYNVKVKVRYFFSLNRLVWNNWEDFIIGLELVIDIIELVYLIVLMIGVLSIIGDYMGISISVNILGVV